MSTTSIPYLQFDQETVTSLKSGNLVRDVRIPIPSLRVHWSIIAKMQCRKKSA